MEEKLFKLNTMPQANELSIGQMNEVIALFMDGVAVQFRDRYITWGRNNTMPVKELQYHSSWDWLMPVVEKINTLKVHNPDGKDLALMSTLTVYMEICGHRREASCSILGYITHCHTLTIPYNYVRVALPSIFVHGEKTLIEATYKGVYQFIQWYNKLTTNNESKS